MGRGKVDKSGGAGEGYQPVLELLPAASEMSRVRSELRSPAPRTEYKTPLIPKIHPKMHPKSSPETKVRKNYEKNRFSFFFFFRVIFSYFGFGRGLGCILGCILGIRGVLYSVRGAGDRKLRSAGESA